MEFSCFGSDFCSKRSLKCAQNKKNITYSTSEISCLKKIKKILKNKKKRKVKMSCKVNYKNTWRPNDVWLKWVHQSIPFLPPRCLPPKLALEIDQEDGQCRDNGLIHAQCPEKDGFSAFIYLRRVMLFKPGPFLNTPNKNFKMILS